jgi:hypothetical protein
VNKMQERVSDCHYINNEDFTIKVKIVCQCSQRDIGTFAEPRININNMDVEVIAPRGGGLIYLNYDGISMLSKEYLVYPGDVYIFNCTGKILQWDECKIIAGEDV